MQLVQPMLLTVCAVLLFSCNDLPNEVGTELVPGTDTLYSVSSLTIPIIISGTTSTLQTPLYNSPKVLYGKTADSDARMFIEFVNYPKLGAADSFEVISSELIVKPEPYRYGDTNDLTLSIHAYELKQIWSAQATWDSIWAPDGSTQYYSNSDAPVATFDQQLAITDSTVYVPFDLVATKRWLVLGSDSATKDQLFGLALIPESGTSVRSYRNLLNNKQEMKLRVVYKHADSTTNDTAFVEAAVAYFVHTPNSSDSTEMLVQGAQIHRTQLTIQIDSLDEFAIIIGASMSVHVDLTASNLGVYGLDELLTMIYSRTDGSKITYTTRGTADGEFVFPNVSSMLQFIRKDGGTGTVTIEPEGENRYNRMNRLKIFGLQADEQHRPALHIVYTIPTVFQ